MRLALLALLLLAAPALVAPPAAAVSCTSDTLVLAGHTVYVQTYAPTRGGPICATRVLIDGQPPL